MLILQPHCPVHSLCSYSLFWVEATFKIFFFFFFYTFLFVCLLLFFFFFFFFLKRCVLVLQHSVLCKTGVFCCCF